MAKGISIGVASDTREFSKGIKSGVIDPLDDAVDALEKVGKEGDRTGDDLTSMATDGRRAGSDLERSLDAAGDATKDLSRDARKSSDVIEDSMKDAQRQTEKFGKSQSELADTMASASKRGSQAVATNTKEAVSATAEGMEELKGEAIANLSETVSSFDGSLESFADMAQGTLGGVVAGLGPIGAAAGAAGALGIGLIMAAVGQANEETEAYRQIVSDLAAEYIETGKVGSTSLDYMIDKIKEAATTTDDSSDSLTEMRRIARTAGVDFRTLTDAYAGNSEGLDKIIDRQKEIREQLKKNRVESFAGATEEQIDNSIKVQALDKVIGKLEEMKGANEDATAASEASAAAGLPELEAKRNALETINGELGGAIGLYSDFEATEKKAIDPAGYIKAMQERASSTQNWMNNVDMLSTKFNLSADEVQAILDQGVDMAPMLQSIINAGLDDQFIEQIRIATGGGQAVLDGADLHATVQAKANVIPAEGELKTTADKKRDSTIDTKADTKAAKKDLQDVAGAKYEAKINTRADLDGARRDLDQLAKQSREALITTRADVYAAARDLDNLVSRPRVAQITVQYRDEMGRKVY